MWSNLNDFIAIKGLCNCESSWFIHSAYHSRDERVWIHHYNSVDWWGARKSRNRTSIHDRKSATQQPDLHRVKPCFWNHLFNVSWKKKNKRNKLNYLDASLDDENLPCDWFFCLWRETSVPIAETGLPEKNEKLSRRVEAKTGVSISKSVKLYTDVVRKYIQPQDSYWLPDLYHARLLLLLPDFAAKPGSPQSNGGRDDDVTMSQP